MKKEWILVPLACSTLLFAGWADAQGFARAGRGSAHVRVSAPHGAVRLPARVSRGTSSRRVGNVRRSAGRHTGSTSNRARGNEVPALRGLNRGRALGSGAGPLGGLLQDLLYNEYGGGRRFDPYAGEKAQAKAYRDAAIANAIVNVVGILATTHQQRQYTTYAAAPAPRGHVERQRILVHEGRTEEYQVWIPQYTLPNTGEVVLGHNETRRREIPPVYEEREVWIPTP